MTSSPATGIRRSVAGTLALACGLGAATLHLHAASTPQPPRDLGGRFAAMPEGAPNYANAAVRLADGSLESLFRVIHDGRFSVHRIRSTDRGLTWSVPELVLTLPPGKWGGPMPLLDQQGEIHFVIPFVRRDGGKPGIDKFIDLYHVRSSERRTSWSEPRMIYEGYVGSIQCLVQLSNGRIVAPFAEWRAGTPLAPPTGPSITTVVTSSDGGTIWTLSDSKLSAPCHDGYNGNNYGACEPSLVELRDGRAWMLMRTQAGHMYESFSRDGVTWSPAKRSIFHGSNSPSFQLRLTDGRLVVFWNNCTVPPRVGGQIVYSGRDALHAAISADEGKTWHGFREVYRDPTRNATPPVSGDRGTAYPHATMSDDRNILLVAGQGATLRHRFIIDPEWLMARTQDERFENLDAWHVFRGFGPARRSWRDREAGAQLVAHPDRPGSKALHLRKPEERDADGASWNFPSGRRGVLTLRIRCEPGFGGAQVGLADHFFDPCDDQGEALSSFALVLDPNGAAGGTPLLQPGRWHEVKLAWDVTAGQCAVSVDGQEKTTLALRHGTETGLSYLRLRSRATTADAAGFLVDSVSVRIE